MIALAYLMILVGVIITITIVIMGQLALRSKNKGDMRSGEKYLGIMTLIGIIGIIILSMIFIASYIIPPNTTEKIVTLENIHNNLIYTTDHEIYNAPSDIIITMHINKTYKIKVIDGGKRQDVINISEVL